MTCQPTARYLVFRESRPDTQNDLWVLPLGGSGKARPILQTDADEPRARFSPDGKLMTYFVDCDGLRPNGVRDDFPGPRPATWQITDVEAGTDGAVAPRSEGVLLRSRCSPAGPVCADGVEHRAASPRRTDAAVSNARKPPEDRSFTPTQDGQRFLFAVVTPDPDLLKYHVAIDWLKHE